ncbi:MAG: nucleotidyltransferase domain-containing protein [Nanoarchaeota archaeon]
MSLKQNELIAYAMDFASYLISKVDGIHRIILHGSIARGDFDDESDIDLFIDVSDIKMEKKIKIIEETYYKTNSHKELVLKGMRNPLSLVIGKLDSDEWKNLKRAIMNTGIILYGKYTSENKEAKHYVLFSFENLKPESKRVGFFRKLFGFNLGKKRYSGLAEKFNIRRLGKGTILVPIEHVSELKRYISANKIQAKLYDVWLED